MTKKEIVKRQKEIKIRLTDEEHQALLDRCNTASLASWMRETCLSEKRTKQSKVVEVGVSTEFGPYRAVSTFV
jgi:hypothetical protein